MRITFSILCSFVLLVLPNNVIASCGAASCPLNNHRHLTTGMVLLGLNYEYINQDEIYAGSSLSYVGAIQNGHHDEVQTLNERNIFQLQYGVSNRLGLNITLPFIHREHSHIERDTSGTTWETWNFSGLGDMSVSAQYGILTPADEFEPYLDVVVGTKLPTGVTNEINSQGEEAEVTIQPGNGSLDGILGINYRQTLFSVPTFSGKFSALPIMFELTFQLNGKGKGDYKFGNALHAHLGTAYQFADHASFLLQVNGRFQDYADVGTTGEPRENTGGSWIYISPGIGLNLSNSFSGNVYFQVPMYQNVHGIQQAAKFNLSFGLTYSFDLFSEE